MVNPLWLEELREELVRQGLPLLYIERLVEELRDHYDDILEEGLNMEPGKNRAEERMGQSAHLAEVTADEYRKGPLPLAIFRKRILTTDLLCGIAVALLLAVAMLTYTLYFSEWFLFGSILGVLPFLVFLALRRFLRSITLDSEHKILLGRSIFPWITFTIPFANVKIVRCAKRHGGYNVAVKRSKAIQPLLFEVWTAEEDRDVQFFMTMLLSHGLNVTQKAAAYRTA